MKLHANKFALAAALAVTILAITNFIVVRILLLGVIRGSSIITGRSIIGLMLSFVGTYVTAWLLASIYNKLLDRP